MKKTLIFFIFLMLNAGCAPLRLALPAGSLPSLPGQIRLDMNSVMGHKIRPEFTIKNFDLHVHFVSSQQLKRAYSASGMIGFEGMGGRGITLNDVKAGRCDIYIQRPQRPLGLGMLALGHEVAHCLFGNYHPPVPPYKTADMPSKLVSLARRCMIFVLGGKTLPAACREHYGADFKKKKVSHGQ